MIAELADGIVMVPSCRDRRRANRLRGVVCRASKSRAQAHGFLSPETFSFPPMSPAAAARLGGDQLEAIVIEHSAAVYRLARSVVRDDALADDVTQETFIKVWKHLDDFRGDSSLRSWVLRIAHNTAVSTLRTIKDSATDPSKLPEADDPIATTRVVEGRIATHDLRAALDQLDDLTREIVVLREIEGMSYEEISETLGVPIPTVKTRLLRARRRLTVMLEGWRS
jgi:RNA polymerase sigma-70 factor, ECF subfamily